jgi:hypothetical protein
VLRPVTRKASGQSSAGSHGARPLVGRSFRARENARGTRIMNFGSTDGGPSANSRLPVHRAARRDRRRHRSCAPDDRQEQPSQLAKVKLVKQLTLIALQPSIHGERSLMFCQQDGITAYHLTRPTSATKSAPAPSKFAILSPPALRTIDQEIIHFLACLELRHHPPRLLTATGPSL